ncbi:putative phenylacetic acid degradation protein PaaD/phenylacetate-CoA oxygenase, PaaJ subunit [Pseudoclavibacter endophyticus]|uniref:Phenylacetate-CoA oxygenase subunit PaaJ n=1 Tax=Pseudoclavibacter endophyticus TaxID=1778590 RepID=A0A6H9WU64_9MICO|nr:1,2-phenylacetyl-CoA epoxidase subunit PaaD [Pseudoclavibacter endophyticus]KAB1650215.1 phenylacetate-CoA oxygenase subunit PaaJ [Pseudoclavibacter endophyticus]GGA56130.1 putative phenylacetic acid degradation protein PaaD/phenylacetate-CoA oxygenase, PaaJ subunit [Pseudoclavibacter endophyticus]
MAHARPGAAARTALETRAADDTRAAGASTRPEGDEDARVWDVAATVNDPEIPVLSIADLGILRGARADGDDGAVVTITPTYSGCPAMDTITADVERALAAAGYVRIAVELSLSPAWTTDWMTAEGREKLERYGIAPPTGRAAARPAGPVRLTISVRCPRCGSLHTRELSRFGSTSCKALYSCLDCQEPFDYFKVL